MIQTTPSTPHLSPTHPPPTPRGRSNPSMCGSTLCSTTPATMPAKNALRSPFTVGNPGSWHSLHTLRFRWQRIDDDDDDDDEVFDGDSSTSHTTQSAVALQASQHLRTSSA